MAIRVTCSCGKAFDVPDSAAGKTGRCRSCGASIVVPKSETKTELAERSTTALMPVSPVEHPPVSVIVYANTPAVACGYCGEAILATARKCKHCGEIIDPDLRREIARSQALTPTPSPAVSPPPTVVVHNSPTMVTRVTTNVFAGRKRGGCCSLFVLVILVLIVLAIIIPKGSPRLSDVPTLPPVTIQVAPHVESKPDATEAPTVEPKAVADEPVTKAPELSPQEALNERARQERARMIEKKRKARP